MLICDSEFGSVNFRPNYGENHGGPEGSEQCKLKLQLGWELPISIKSFNIGKPHFSITTSRSLYFCWYICIFQHVVHPYKQNECKQNCFEQ